MVLVFGMFWRPIMTRRLDDIAGILFADPCLEQESQNLTEATADHC